MDSLENGRVRLRRAVGLGFGIAVTVGGTVGAGILLSPATIAASLGRADLILLVWIFVALLAMLGANCYAELATALPHAGGPYVYAHRAIGPSAGFAVGWCDWIAQCCAGAYCAVTLGNFLASLLPGLRGHEALLGIAVLVGLTLMNLRGIGVASVFQQWMSAAKAIGLIAIAIGCWFVAGETGGSALKAPSLTAPVGIALLAPFVLSVRAAIETYSGWNGVVYFSEDQREPAKDLSRSLYWGIAGIAALYVLVNASVLAVMPMSELQRSVLPVADAARHIFGGASSQVVTLLSAVSMLGILHVTVMGAPRILFGLARDRLMHAGAAQVTSSGAPGTASAITTAAMCILALSSSFTVLFAMAGFMNLVTDAVVYVSFFNLRRWEPHLARPYRAIGYPWLPMCALLLSATLLLGFVAGDWRTSLYTAALLAACYPVFLVISARTRRSNA